MNPNSFAYLRKTDEYQTNFKTMKQICIQLTDERHAKLIVKSQDGSKNNLEHGTFSGFSIILEEAFPADTSFLVNWNGEMDLGDMTCEII